LVLRLDSDRLERLAGGFVSPQTPAPTEDGRVYVPDYALGIALVEASRHEISWVRAPPNVALSGIDGLYWQGGALWAIQNGTHPPRVVRFALSPDGRGITGARVLAAGNPNLGEPTHGAFASGAFWFLAASGWSRFDETGQLVKDPPPDAPAVWRVPLDPLP
jgi:hypothetical protein